MSKAYEVRCRRVRSVKDVDSCLTCPFEKCVYDKYSYMRSDSVADVPDDSNMYVIGITGLHVQIFKNTTDGAKWLVSNGCKEQDLKRLSSRIRAGIKRYSEVEHVSWVKVDIKDNCFYEYATSDSVVYVHQGKNDEWEIVRKCKDGKTHKISADSYKDRSIAQVVLDLYADRTGMRLSRKIS